MASGRSKPAEPSYINATSSPTCSRSFIPSCASRRASPHACSLIAGYPASRHWSAMDTYGRIDTWVNCAAVSLFATFEETTPEEFRRLMEVNYLGQVHGALAALPYLRQAGQ